MNSVKIVSNPVSFSPKTTTTFDSQESRVFIRQMFKMNPAAKEFVPAHILKKRQEEAARVGDLADQMNKIDIKKENGKAENGECPKEKSSVEDSTTSSKKVHGDSTHSNNISKEDESDKESQQDNKKDSTTSAKDEQKTSNTQINESHTNNSNNISNNNHHHYESEQDLIDEQDDRFLLNAGENLCEFNGEEFIIPGDDECQPPSTWKGYDFGNNEDNEDEDICNAFEEFLGNLPDQ